MEEWVKRVLEGTDVKINGTRPFDLQVHNQKLFRRVLFKGSLGLGEAYVDGWWDSEALDQTIAQLLSKDIKSVQKNPLTLLHILNARISNAQSKRKAFRVGEAHYDVGNDLYERMLDTRMVYTCGYWSGTPKATNLDQAQEAKLDLVCRKIGLKEGDHILDIGCGWGSFLKFAAERYGVSGVGLTVSREQKALAEKRLHGLPIEIRLQDYREVSGSFDHVISLGMFEHVGYRNYKVYMELVRRVLKEKGFFLLHTIGSSKSVYTADPWINKYIFPGGMLPSIQQIGSSLEGLFVMEDWHNFGADYETTLMHWFKNFDEHWNEIKDNYSDRFYRIWKYYLLSCAGAFRMRKNIELWQVVLSKNGVEGGYRAVR